jgi:hypothetical protein
MSKPVSRRTAIRTAGIAVATPLFGQIGRLLAGKGVGEGSALAEPAAGLAAEGSRTEAVEPSPYRGNWHGATRYFGFHHDTHVLENDRDIGARANPDELVPMLKLTGADFVQTDSKGHPGYTCWFSKTPGASVSPGIVKDSVRGWREATKRLGLPLHCHYSGLFDKRAGVKHPEWCAIRHDGKPVNSDWFGVVSSAGDRMCPRSGYVDELMIPQLIELIDRYQVDGFWIDGDIWAAQPCYCERCCKAFREATGTAAPPAEPSDPHWAAWWNFTRESVEQYITHYCDAVHRHKPGVLICSNWLQMFRHPGEPKVPTDWLSGDNQGVWGLDNCRCEARFLSTRGKPWDLMMWDFYWPHDRPEKSDTAAKPVEMMQQEAAIIVAFGGNVQVCQNPFDGVRTGQLIPWQMRRIGQLAEFVHRRRELCQGTDTVPQAAVLHSEHHLRAMPCGGSLTGDTGVAPVEGAVHATLECHYGVDILDEWAILPRLARFPVVVAPEQIFMSEKIVDALKEYVRSGGKLLVSGAKAFERFGGPFLGVAPGRLVEKAIYYVPAGDGAAPVASAAWRLLETTTAEKLAPLGTTPLLDERLLPNPAATLHRIGRGAVAYIPCDVFREFRLNRYPPLRLFLHDVLRRLAGPLDIEVAAPSCVDVVLRRQGTRRIVHLINRSSGVSTTSISGMIDEIPPVGPITIRMRTAGRPQKVHVAFENPAFRTTPSADSGGRLAVCVSQVHIHAAVVVETA